MDVHARYTVTLKFVVTLALDSTAMTTRTQLMDMLAQNIDEVMAGIPTTECIEDFSLDEVSDDTDVPLHTVAARVQAMMLRP